MWAIAEMQLPLMGVEPLVVGMAGRQVRAMTPRVLSPPKGMLEQTIKRGRITLESRTEVRPGVATSCIFLEI